MYRKFLDGVPEYLARYYWWAYLWHWSIWFFDHQPIINAILFGPYDKLLKKTLAQIENKPSAKILDGGPNVEHCFTGFYRVMRFNVA